MNRNIETFEYIFPARVLDDGKVTIPKAIRDKLGIKKGDLVTIVIRVSGKEKEVEINE
jgi:AbrB family looped-hinge helix DNA binding protein